jgi:transposase
LARRDRNQNSRHGIDRRVLVAAFEVLESHGLEVILANAREARAVPGRKSDVNDAQWLQRLQRLHACGLLRASFRPSRDMAELRAYLCAREKHTDHAAAHIQHMQKALRSPAQTAYLNGR